MSPILYVPDFLDQETSDRVFESMLAAPWRQDRITVYGKTHLVPRLQQWYGDPGHVYTWGGARLEPLPWPPELAAIRAELARRGYVVNSCLANLYRDGNDKVGWHADDEPELGIDPVIPSVSLGAERDFDLRNNVTGEKVRQALGHGSLAVMLAGTQRMWKHQIPVRRRVQRRRVNLTYRMVFPT